MKKTELFDGLKSIANKAGEKIKEIDVDKIKDAAIKSGNVAKGISKTIIHETKKVIDDLEAKGKD